MTPHVLAKQAKEIGITSKDGEKWETLVKSVKISLVDRFNTLTPEEILYDMSFKERRLLHMDDELNMHMTTKYSSPTSIKEIDTILSKVKTGTKAWIKKTRAQLLKETDWHFMQLLTI